MSTPKFTYTLSSQGDLVGGVMQSIKSLLNWVDPRDIIVFYTPPRHHADQDALTELGVDLRETDNQTLAFSIRSGFDASHYGEKVQIGEIDADTVVFLDCDTVILDDPEVVIAGDFDFKARPGSYDVSEEEWRSMFQAYGEEYLSWMPNAGFMVFKNRTHQKVQSDWRQYIKEGIELPSAGMNHGEQYALALAVSGYETAQMSPSEHAYGWAGETPADGVVYHGFLKDTGGSFVQHAKAGVKELLSGNI